MVKVKLKFKTDEEELKKLASEYNLADKKALKAIEIYCLIEKLLPNEFVVEGKGIFGINNTILTLQDEIKFVELMAVDLHNAFNVFMSDELIKRFEQEESFYKYFEAKNMLGEFSTRQIAMIFCMCFYRFYSYLIARRENKSTNIRNLNEIVDNDLGFGRFDLGLVFEELNIERENEKRSHHRYYEVVQNKELYYSTICKLIFKRIFCEIEKTQEKQQIVNENNTDIIRESLLKGFF
ncbi:hypothetical protein [Campylobacter sp. RM12637]|uniref:hypothetical protein n=1 Tax=Campylobacter sp. RM12637 TaxID=2735734 RepID=UPI0030144204|nr:hypothetical protein [Campylobacter sp. RM12637]